MPNQMDDLLNSNTDEYSNYDIFLLNEKLKKSNDKIQLNKFEFANNFKSPSYQIIKNLSKKDNLLNQVNYIVNPKKGEEIVFETSDIKKLNKYLNDNYSPELHSRLNPRDIPTALMNLEKIRRNSFEDEKNFKPKKP